MANGIPRSGQIEHRSTLPQIAGTEAKPKLSEALPEINNELTPLLYLRANDSGNDRQLNIGSSYVQNSITGVTKDTLDFSGFTSGTITFPSTSGGVVTIFPGSNNTLTVSPNNYIKVLIEIDSLLNLSIKTGIENTTESTATLPTRTKGKVALGYVVIFNNAGTIDNLIGNMIHKYDVPEGLLSHESSTTGIHGVSGNVVGTTDTQTLSNKTLTSPTLNAPFVTTPSRLDLKQDTKANLDTYASTASSGQLVYATDEKKTYQVVDNMLKQIAGSGGGSFSYNDNDYNTNIAGVTGDTNLVVSQETTSPLFGTGSLKITKSASNVAGQEVILKEFTLLEAHAYSPLEVNFGFKETSGSVADDDYRIVIRKDPAGTPVDIRASKEFHVGSTLPTKQAFGPYQVQEVDTYQVVLIWVGTGTSAAEFLIDGYDSDAWYVGPAKEAARGAVVTDSKDYTPTLSWVSNRTVEAKYTQVGEKLRVTFGISVTGAISSSGLSITIPAGLTIDTTKLPTSASSAIGNASLTISGVLMQGIVVQVSSTSVGILGIRFSSATNQDLTGLSNFTFANGDKVSGYFEVPIQGWSSNVVMSSESSGREIYVDAYGNDGEVITAGTEDIPWKTVDEGAQYWTNAGNTGSNTADTFTAPETAKYLIDGRIATASVLNQINAYVDGVYYKIVTTYGTAESWKFSTIIPLNKDQKLTFRFSTNNATLVNSSKSKLSIYKLSSSSPTIAQSEKVYVRASKDDGQVFANGTADVITFNKTQINSHGSSVWNGSTFTAPRSGYLKVNASILWNGSTLWVKPASHSILVYKNGTVFSYLQYKSIQIDTAGTLIYADNSGYDLIPVNQGDVVDLRGLQGSGGNNAIISTEVYNHVIFEMD